MTDSQADPLRVVLVGCGQMGRNHARVLADLAGVTLAGVYDPDLEASAALCERYDTAAYTDWGYLLEHVRAGYMTAAVVATTSRRTAVIAGASVPNGNRARSIPFASTR